MFAMKKYVIIVIFLMSCFSVGAQSQNSQSIVNDLIEKVDSLEHELSYLKLSYEISMFNSDLRIFRSEVNHKAYEIQSNMLNKIFDDELYEAYSKFYNGCLQQQEALMEAREVKKLYFTLKIMTSPFNESEFNILMASYNMIDNEFDTLKTTMDYLKKHIEVYKKYLLRYKAVES